MSYFLHVDGINGDATDDGHKGWFTVTGMSWGVIQSVSPNGSGGPGSGAGVGKATVQPIEVTMPSSLSTPLLFAHCAQGRRIDAATLEVWGAGDAPALVARWQLDHVRGR